MCLFRYPNLILVAGGIGISPFLAILNDILHRINENKPCSPRKILIVWAVKKSNELPLLHSVDMESMCPRFSDTLNLEIQTYVTRESEPSLVRLIVLYTFSKLKPILKPSKNACLYFCYSVKTAGRGCSS